MKKQEKTKSSNGGILKILYSIVDGILITPISRIAYFIKDKLSFKSGFIDRILNKPNVLLYLSLALAFVCFFAVDRKVINFTDTEAVVLSNQKVNVEYNEEAYVVEGLPSTADIILMGKKSGLYLAQQLGDHRISIDLTNYGVGTHKVKLEYNNPINSLNYKLDPGNVTIVVYPKVSEVRTLSIDIINTDRLDETLVVSNVLLDRDDVIIKSYQEKLNTVANVKAIVDVNSINASESGTYTIENVKLIAYDDSGKEIKGIEIVPATVTATVTITSPSKTVPLRVVPKGEVRSGSAISSIVSNVTEVTVYADESILSGLDYIEVEIDVTNLSEDKVYQKYINKPAGSRSISVTSVQITVTMEQETSKDFQNISIETRNLDSKFMVQASSKDDALVSVTVRGVKSLLDQLEDTNIKAYVDLKDITETGTYNVPVYVEGTDVRLTYTSRTRNVQIIVLNNTNS
jgi:YbbR domain-containing protein